MLQLILASQSPRRRELLEKAGYEFTVDTVKVSETIDKNLNPIGLVEKLALKKANASLQSGKFLKGKGFLLLSADTIVAIDDEVLGKPQDFRQAKEFLTRLSSKMHSVYTAICLVNVDSSQQVLATDESRVWFRKLLVSEIEAYIKTGEPMDKAGAYAIQGRAADFVVRLEGSKTNVIGLPMELLERTLKSKGWNVPRRAN